MEHKFKPYEKVKVNYAGAERSGIINFWSDELNKYVVTVIGFGEVKYFDEDELTSDEYLSQIESVKLEAATNKITINSGLYAAKEIFIYVAVVGGGTGTTATTADVTILTGTNTLATAKITNAFMSNARGIQLHIKRTTDDYFYHTDFGSSPSIKLSQSIGAGGGGTGHIKGLFDTVTIELPDNAAFPKDSEYYVYVK